MEDILKKLSDHAVYRTEEKKKEIPFTAMRALAEGKEVVNPGFLNNLKKPGISFICEVKKASPSKGIIAEDFPYLDIALAYDRAGADAISVLTEPKWFLGSDKYLEEISEKVSTPLLRKDFTVDEYMIYEAKVIGAAAILLIVSILEEGKLKEYLTISQSLGLDALVEAHDEVEIELAIKCGAQIIGVNNRNLRDFSVDTKNAGRLRSLVPEGIVFVSESGISGPEGIKDALDSGADAVLIGEALMRSEDKAKFLHTLRSVR